MGKNKKLDYRNITPNDVNPVVFDLETTGLQIDDEITVAGFMRRLNYDNEDIYKIIMFLSTTDLDNVEKLENNIQNEMESHPKIQLPVNVSIHTVESESKLVQKISDSVGGIVKDENDVLTTFNGYNYRSGFDYAVLSNAVHFSDTVQEHPFRNLAHVDLMDYVVHRDLFNLTTQEISVDSMYKSFNSTPFKELVSHIEDTFDKNIVEKYDISTVEDIEIKLNELMESYDNMSSGEKIQKAVSEIDSDIPREELIGMSTTGWVCSNKGDTADELRNVSAILELPYIESEIESYYTEEGEELPTVDKTTLDGIYDVLVTRGDGESYSVDPLDGDSSKAPEAYYNGDYEDLCLHLADDLWMTLYTSESIQRVVPKYEFSVNVF